MDGYQRTFDDLLFKCLNDDEAKITKGEVHEGIYVHIKSVPKVNWLLRRADFYWPKMITACFRDYKVSDECQGFSDILLVPAAPLNSIGLSEKY